MRELFRLALRRLHPARSEVDDEVELHLQLRTEQLVARGMSPEAARAEARRRFGENRGALHRAATRREDRMRVREWLESVGQDIRIALRGLRREPKFTGFVLVTMALGIGANAGMFGVVDRLLLRGPEHVVDPSRVVRFYFSGTRPNVGELTWSRMPYAAYDDLRKDSRSFSGVATYTTSTLLVGSGGAAQPVPVGFASEGFFPLLGVQPALGRFFTPAESEIHTPQRLAVLGFGYWQRGFGGDPGVLGRSILVDQESFTIIGVAPRGFSGPDLTSVNIWMPLNVRGTHMYSTPSVHWTRRWNTSWLDVIGRLKPGVTREEASTDATRSHQRQYDGGQPWMKEARMFVAPVSRQGDGREAPEASILRWLVGVSVAVLLIACSNVGNLLLARTIRRRGELAVRLALGAGRGRLTRLLLTEGLLLAVGGGIAGLAVAYGTGTLLRGMITPNVEWTSSPLGGQVLGASLLIAVVTGVVIGLIPSFRAGRSDLATALKSGAREGRGQRSRARGLLTVAQAALSVVLLVGAGLFVRSLARVYAFDLGFEPDRVLSVGIRWPERFGQGAPSDSAERIRQEAYYAQALRAIRELPGVAYASRTEGPPPLEGAISVDIKVPGLDSIPKDAGGGPFVAAVSADYFATVGTRILRGRTFTPDDRAGSAPVTIVSETMAARLWPGAEPLGQCIVIGERPALPCSTVVGVSADVRRFGLRDNASMSYYVPVGQEVGFSGPGLVVRPSGEAGPVMAGIKAILRALDPSILYVDVDLLQDRLDPQIRPWRLGATMFVLSGALALVVAAIGLYSVISYQVAHRTHELGVRIALGASGGAIVRLIVREGLVLAAAGTVAGIGFALVAGKWLEPLLFHTSARDPLVIGGVGIGLLLVALAASALPAMRARRVAPMTALRAD